MGFERPCQSTLGFPIDFNGKQISDFNIGPMERSIYRNNYRSEHRLKLSIGYVANRAEYRYIGTKGTDLNADLWQIQI